MKTISTDTRTLAPGAKGDGSFTEKNFPLEGRRTGKSCEMSPKRAIRSKPCNIPLWMGTHILHILCMIWANILFGPPRCTYVLSQRVSLFWTGEAGQEAAQGELCPGTITVFASQKHLAPILEEEWRHSPLPSSEFIKHASAGIFHSSPDDKNDLNQRKHVQMCRRQITNILSTRSHKAFSFSAFCPQDPKLRIGQKTSMILD